VLSRGLELLLFFSGASTLSSWWCWLFLLDVSCQLSALWPASCVQETFVEGGAGERRGGGSEKQRLWEEE
jgi:hypothetical protein